MFPLKPLLAQYGFSSDESYDHAVRCFLTSQGDTMRCLNVDGNSGRRRTAFANALAHSLGADQVLYYEFGREKPVPQIIRIQEGEEIIEEPPVEAFDRILTEACAQSEAEHTVLILDQLHKTQFLNHIRLYEFIKTGVWAYSDVQYQANMQNIKLFLISDEKLYHSLHTVSFRVRVNEHDSQSVKLMASDLGLNEDDCDWFLPLQNLLSALGVTPTHDEYRKLIYDIEQQVRNAHQLKITLYGWLEKVDWEDLEAEKIQPYLEKTLDAIQQSLEIQEEIEISGL
jgi:hypothetical protein